MSRFINFFYLLPFLLLMLLLCPEPALAQTEFPIEVTLECEGNYPPDKEYSFRFSECALNSWTTADFVSLEGGKTFTLHAGETKTVAKAVIDTSADFREGGWYEYTFRIYQENLTDLDEPGVLIDPSEKQRTLRIVPYKDPEKCEMEFSYSSAQNTHSFSAPEEDSDKIVFKNIYADPESTDLSIRTAGYNSYKHATPCRVWFFDDKKILSGSYPFSGDETKTEIKSGDEFIPTGNTYTVSGLPPGTRYAVCPEYESTEKLYGPVVPDNNKVRTINGSGKVPNTAIIDYFPSANFCELCGIGYYPLCQKTMVADGLEPELYRVRFSLFGDTAGSITDEEIYLLGEGGIIPFPLIRDAKCPTRVNSIDRSGNHQQETIAEWKVQIEPIFEKPAGHATEYYIKTVGTGETASESGDGSYTLTKEIVETPAPLSGRKTENGTVPKNIYNFKIEPVSGRAEDEKSYLADGDKIFFAVLEKELSGLRFTDEMPPDEQETRDYSATRDGSVLGWQDGGTLVISTATSGRKVIFEDFNLSRAKSRDGRRPETLDVTMMKPVGSLSFSWFAGKEITGLTDLDTSLVTSMDSLFYYCQNLESVEGIDKWNTGNVINLSRAFCETLCLSEITVPHWDVSKVEDFSYCFCSYSSSALASIDLSYWNVRDGANVNKMFQGRKSLRNIYASEWSNILSNESGSSDSPGSNVFMDCTLLSGYSSSKISAAFCKNTADGGYFTSPRGDSSVSRNPVYELPHDKYSETVEEEEIPLPSRGTDATNNGEDIGWGYLYFDCPGVYTYKISETDDGQEGVTYDKQSYILTCTVTEDKSAGEVYKYPLKTEVEISPQDEIVFENRVNMYPTLEIPVQKILNNTPVDWGGDFTFTLAPSEETKLQSGYTMPESTTLALSAGESGSFGAITFEKAGDYSFNVSENNEAAENIVYDKSVWTVDVKIGDSMEIISAEYTDSIPDGVAAVGIHDPFAMALLEQDDKAVFANTYREGLQFSPKTKKTILSSAGEKPDETFSFSIAKKDAGAGAELPANTTATVKGEGEAEFEPIVFTEAGTYTFTISETAGSNRNIDYDPIHYTLSVQIKEDEGTLSLGETTYTPE